MDYAHIKRPDLRYRYQFSIHELDAAIQCMNDHGFCVVEDVLPKHIVTDLQKAVVAAADPNGTLAPGQSYTHTSFVEEYRQHKGPFRGAGQAVWRCDTPSCLVGTGLGTAPPTRSPSSHLTNRPSPIPRSRISRRPCSSR